MTDVNTVFQALGESKAEIIALKEDVREIKENQKVFLEFISEQKAGKKYMWILFGTIATFITFFKDVISTLSGFFSFKGFK